MEYLGRSGDLHNGNQNILETDPSIEYLELLAACMAVFIWSERLRNKRIILFCDNQTVVMMINKMTSKYKNCMILIRMLVQKSIQYNLRVFCNWVMGAKN